MAQFIDMKMKKCENDKESIEAIGLMGEFDLKPVEDIGVMFGFTEIGVLIEIKIVVRVDTVVKALFLGLLEINGCFIGVSEGDLAEVVD